MPTITRYAIRQIKTGYYLPNPNGRAGRGGSHVEPREFSHKSYETPRLFSTLSAARQALTIWSKGRHDGDGCVISNTSRPRNSMEVVEILLHMPN